MAESGKAYRRQKYFHWIIKQFCPNAPVVHWSPYFKLADIIWGLEMRLCTHTRWYVLTLTNFCEAEPNYYVRLGLKTSEGLMLTRAEPIESGRKFTANIISRQELSTERWRTQILHQGDLNIVCEIATQSTGDMKEGWRNDAEENVALKSIEKLQLDFERMYLNAQNSDVVLRVENKEFRAHRNILAARSPVFAAMFSHDMQEKTSGLVTVEDNDSGTFSNFLLYLYTGRVPEMSLGNVAKLYTTADKYQVPKLKDECLIFMIKNITQESICDFLNLALQHREGELIAAAKSFLSEQ